MKERSKWVKRWADRLEWYGNHQKHVWLVGFVLIIVWAAYDTGTVVEHNSLASNLQTVQGAWTTETLSKTLSAHPGGHLLITPDGALYEDVAHKTWSIVDFSTQVNQKLLNDLKAAHVDMDGAVVVSTLPGKRSTKDVLLSTILDLAIKIGFLAFYAALVYVGYRQWKTAGGQTWGKPRFRAIDRSKVQAQLSDVAGHEGPKQEIVEIVEYLKSPERFRRAGALPIRGVLLYGPPGNGKTLLAKAVAGEANASFLEQNAASFVQLFVGSGALAVKQLFDAARKAKPSIVFIDEFDALGASRDGVGSNDERVQALNALLAEMDGFADNDGVLVVAATNRLQELDAALLRPGRFDRKVRIPLPSRNDRKAILALHMRRLPHATADLERWADQTRGFSGADLANLVNEAAVESSRLGQTEVSDAEFSRARDRVLGGAHDRGRTTSTRDRRFVAYHELGHAVVSIATGGVVEKVSILPRGTSLGMTIAQADEEEQLLKTEQEIQDELKVLMGGRAAEELFCHAITGGAADDMQRASRLAREAIRRFGFGADAPYVPEHEALLQEVERKAAEWVRRAYNEAKESLTQHREAIDRLFEQLLDREELTGHDIEMALRAPGAPRAEVG